MKKLMNEKGLSLVELLATLAIVSIILLFISNIHLFIHKQYDDQSVEVGHLFDITYASKVIVKDVRKANSIETPNSSTIMLDGVEYKYKNKSIEKNGTPFVTEIEQFFVNKDGNELVFKIIGPNNKKVDTVITIREGD